VTRRIVTVGRWTPQAGPGEPVKHRGRVPATEDARARRELPPADLSTAEGPHRMTRQVHPITGRLHLSFHCERGHVLGHKIVGRRALDTAAGRLKVDLWVAERYMHEQGCRLCNRHEAEKDTRPRQNFVP
jgi:hypothetical protein